VVSNTPIETSLFSFSPDAKTLITVQDGGSIAAGSGAAVWDMPDGKLRAVFRPPNQQTYESRAAPNGLIAASAVNDGTVRLWDVRTGRERVALGGQLNSFHCVAWTLDGSRLAASGGDGSITLWSAATYAGYLEVAKLKGHHSAVQAIRFLPDGNTLVSASRDELIRWRAAPLSETDAQR